MQINHLNEILTRTINIVIVTVLCGFIAGCAPKIQQSPRPTDKPDTTRHNLPEFEQEGFVNGSTYRVIIIEPIGKVAPQSMKTLEATARSRTLSSLQKYLISRGKQVNAGVRTRLLNLVNEYGTLRLIEKHNETRRVYYFDIHRSDLRQYLSDICEVR